MKWKVVIAVLFCAAIVFNNVKADDGDTEDYAENVDTAAEDAQVEEIEEGAVADAEPEPPAEPAAPVAEEPIIELDTVVTDDEDPSPVEKAAKRGKYYAYDDYYGAQASSDYAWSGEFTFFRNFSTFLNVGTKVFLNIFNLFRNFPN